MRLSPNHPPLAALLAAKAHFPNCLTDATDAHWLTYDGRANADLRSVFSSLVPARPYCADLPSDGLKIRDRKVALEHRHVQLNGKYLYTWMSHDIDHSDAYNAHRDANLPPPNFIAINPENGHGHCAVLLATPVSCYDASHVEPLRFYSAVERGITRRIRADRHYVGLITKNPLHPHWRVEWRCNRPYSLHELADWLFFHDMRPDPRPDTMGAGRNVLIFEELRLIAYSEVRKFKKDGANLDQWRDHLEMLATNINHQFVGYSARKPDGRCNVGPLRPSEVRAIAKSVADWVWRHMSTAGFSARQSRIGKLGNAKRWADHIPTEVTKPWEAEGIHGATWYRRKRLNGNGTSCVSDERQRSSATIAISDNSLLAGSAGSPQAVRVIVFRGELPQVAIARHMELRPEHRGRPINLEYRNDARDHVHELFAVHSLDEIRAVMEAISRANKGNLGDQIVKRRAA